MTQIEVNSDVTESRLTPEDHAALIDSVARLLGDRCTEDDVRRIMDSDSGHDPELWRALAELGVVGLTSPMALGGLGLGLVEMALVMEEAGAALLPAPLLSAFVAAALLDGDRLAALVDGSRLVAVAFTGSRDWTGRDEVRLESGGLVGTARFVPDAAIADTILIATDDAVFAFERGEVEVTPLPVFDRTRRMADVVLNGPGVRIGDGSRVDNAFNTALVALAAEQVGGARRIMRLAVDYARHRHQFGRAIGSFQAIKHMAADLLLEVENATSAARDAARQRTDGSAAQRASVALAAFTCGDAFVRCAKDAIQMHGGIAFTWEHPAHLYLRRARSGARLFGDGAHWRDRYIRALEAEA
jgi:alkylation response protein AidB-like acyl-CoA dehydrogenase